MILLEEYMWGTASTITKDISLTKDWNKNIIGASIIQQVFGKLFRKIKKTFKKVFDQSTNSGL